MMVLILAELIYYFIMQYNWNMKIYFGLGSMVTFSGQEDIIW